VSEKPSPRIGIGGFVLKKESQETRPTEKGASEKHLKHPQYNDLFSNISNPLQDYAI
jgi:hypothetical protein